MRDSKIGKLGLALAAVLMIGAAVWIATRPARPQVPVPMLSVPADAGFRAELVPWQAELTPLPARIGGPVAAASDGGLLHEWPGITLQAEFSGTAINLRLDDSENRWRVEIDDSTIELSRPGRQELHVHDLQPGAHRITVQKLGESAAASELSGLYLPPGTKPLPAPPARAELVEFIGDSDTVGFGNTAAIRSCTGEEIFAATDTTRAYPALVAKAMGADLRIYARSGIGLLRNYGGGGTVMPQLYPHPLPSQRAIPELPHQAANVIVIALGSNDFGSPLPPGEAWSNKAELAADFAPALVRLAQQALARSPSARLVLLAFGEYGPELIEAHEVAARDLRATGVPVQVVKLGKLRRNACLWHPSLADHQAIARQLLAALAPDMQLQPD